MKYLFFVFSFAVLFHVSNAQEYSVPGMVKANYKIESPIVNLSWLTPNTSNWLQYCDTLQNNTIGLNGNFDVGIKYDTTQLKSYKRARVTKIAIFPTDPSTTYQIKIWTQQGNYLSQLLVQGIDQIKYGEWNVVSLLDDFYIEADKPLIFGYSCFNASAESASYSDSEVIPGYSDLINYGGGFRSVADENIQLSWNIRIFIEPYATDSTINPDYYNIFRNGDMVDQSFENNYNDSLLETGIFNYSISAAYGENESDKSATVKTIYDTSRVNKNTIVIEEFTSVECPMCPGAAYGIADMVDSGYNVAPIAYHTYNFGDDEFANDFAAARESYYKSVISGFPTTIVGGNRVVKGGGTAASSIFNYIKPFYDELINEKTPITIKGSLHEVFNGGYNLSFEMQNVAINEDTVLKLHIALNEDVIFYHWQNMPRLEYVHRELLTSKLGDDITFANDSLISYSIDFDIPDIDRLDNYEVVAFLQNENSRSVVNGVYLKMNEMEYHNHSFNVTLKDEPLIGAEITISSKVIYTDTEGKAFFTQAFNLDSIPYSINFSGEVLHESYFKTNDSIIDVALLKSGNNDLILVDKISIFPNPAKEYIVLNNVENSIVEIFNTMGVLVKTISVSQSQNRIDIGDLSAGTYIVNIDCEYGNVYKKFVIYY